MKATDFMNRLKSMLKVDFRRMFTMPLIYIMAGVSFVLPVLILIMTSMMGEGAFSTVWQSIGSLSGDGSSMSMDLTGMCNINLLYFLAAVLVCVFVADDFRSGYAKNLFTVRAKKSDYVFSKTLVGFVGCVIMIICYFVGAMVGGAIARLSFSADGAGAGGIIMCMLAKTFLIVVFVAIDVMMSTIGKQRLWLSIVGSLCVCMLLFTMIPMMTPLDSSILNVVLCLAGGALFSVGFGAVSNLILQKTNLV